MPNVDERAEPGAARVARLFRNGRNQALRIPREFELDADEVTIHREARRLIIEPIDRKPSIAEVLAGLEPLEEDFLEIEDPPTTPEDLL
ncbi:MAG: AbrB/MazE/SpoVT family DNA-binding domain-containing protein [Acidobacteria bacterium]|nr:AbrB/MazE/SpoVT family DNA-binding domain-containing protein [Acidobacteriota bacterium]